MDDEVEAAGRRLGMADGRMLRALGKAMSYDESGLLLLEENLRKKIIELRTNGAYERMRSAARDLGLVEDCKATRLPELDVDDPPPLLSRSQRLKPEKREDDDEGWSEPVTSALLMDEKDTEEGGRVNVVVEAEEEEEEEDDDDEEGWSPAVKATLINDMFDHELSDRGDHFVLSLKSSDVKDVETDGRILRFNDGYCDLRLDTEVVVSKATRNKQDNSLTLVLTKLRNHDNFMEDLGKTATERGFVPPLGDTLLDTGVLGGGKQKTTTAE